MAAASSQGSIGQRLQVLDDETGRITRQQIAAPAVDGATRGFHPVHQLGARRSIGLARQRAHHVDQRRGALGRFAQRVGRADRAAWCAGAGSFSRSLTAVSSRPCVMVSPGGKRNARSASRARSSASARPVDGRRGRARVFLPFAERARERDEMRGEVARVDRRHVARFERTQVARVVPVVQVPAILAASAPSCRASPRCGRAHRAGRTSRNRAPPPSTADRGRCWWATCGARPPRSGLPGNCRAAGDCLPPSRRSRRSARCAARSVAARAAGSADRSDFATARRRAADAPRDQRRGEPQQQEGQRECR